MPLLTEIVNDLEALLLIVDSNNGASDFSSIRIHSYGRKNVRNRQLSQLNLGIIQESSQEDHTLQAFLFRNCDCRFCVILICTDFVENEGIAMSFQFRLEHRVHTLEEGVADTLADQSYGIRLGKFQISCAVIGHKVEFFHDTKDTFLRLLVNARIIIDCS